MAFLGDVGKDIFGDRSTKDVVGAGVTAYTGNLLYGNIAGNLAGTIAEDISKAGRKGETTTTQTVQSAQAGMGYGPATNVEIDFSGIPDMGGFMPANYTGFPQIPTAPQTPMMQQANILKFAPAVGGAAAGFIADFVVDLFTGETKKMIITRKLRRDTEKLMELYGNDMDAVAMQLSKIKGKQYDSGHVLKILMHKFTNQGAYVTKAAVRKTRKTVRKLDTLCRLQAEICKPTTRARRAPARRTTAMAKASVR
jgi:hypothetical protein